MKPVKQALTKYRSTYAASKANKVTATQLDRLVENDALVAPDGQVWIKSKTVLPDLSEHYQAKLNNSLQSKKDL